MASIIKIGDKHRAQIRRAGQRPMTKTFSTEKEAKQWAAVHEVAIDSGKQVGVHGRVGVTFADAVDQYIEENQDRAKTTYDVLRSLRNGLGKIMLQKMTDQDIVNYIKGKKFSPSSGAGHYSYLKVVLDTAKFGWSYAVPDILPTAHKRLKILKLIAASKKRTRRPTPQEIKMLLEYKYPTPIPMADIIQFAISTAMRQAEITRIKYTTLDLRPVLAHKTVVITDRKHPKIKKGNDKTVPLTPESIEIIKRQVRVDGSDFVFPFNSKTIGTYFTQACVALGIEDLRFHDLRHEGASRLFENGYGIEQVALFTGHESWEHLRRYVQLKAQDICEPTTKKANTTETENA